MEISERLECLFSATVERQDESYVVTVPDRELSLGSIEDGETYRVALVSSADSTDEREATTATDEADDSRRSRDEPAPPVEEGETRDVEIEDIGEQGDGITRVERGFVVIVPDTETGERVTIEVTDVQQNVAFATVVDRLSYYD